IGEGEILGILEYGIDMIVNLAPVLVSVYSSGSDDRLRHSPRKPINGVDLMAAEFCHHAVGILRVKSPVGQMIDGRVTPGRRVEFRVRRLASPISVAVPQCSNMINVPDGSFADELVGLVIKRAVGALMADLEIAPGTPRRLDHLLAIFDGV